MIQIDEENGRALSIPIDAVVGEGIGEFFQGSDASGEDDECIACVHEFLFPFHHVRHFDELGNAPVGLLFRNEDFRDDAGDFSSGRHAGIGGNAHEAHGASTVNHVEAVLSQGLAQAPRKGGVFGIISKAGAAVDGDVFHRLSFL